MRKKLSELTEREKYGGHWLVYFDNGEVLPMDMKKDNNIRVYANAKGRVIGAEPLEAERLNGKAPNAPIKRGASAPSQ